MITYLFSFYADCFTRNFCLISCIYARSQIVWNCKGIKCKFGIFLTLLVYFHPFILILIRVFIKITVDLVMFIYSEKPTNFGEIFPLLLTTVHTVKCKGKISQNFVAFSEYMNFTTTLGMFFCRKGRLYVCKVKFINSEKAIKFCEIFPLHLTVCTVVKSKVF